MYKATLLFLVGLFCLIQLSCRSTDTSENKNSVKEFEGVVTYHEVSKSIDGGNIDDTSTLFYSHGNFVKTHSSGVCVKDFYFSERALRLLLFRSSDILYQLNLTNLKEKLRSFKLSNEKSNLLSKKCEEVLINTEFDEKDSTTYTDYQLIFSRGFLKVNKNNFSNWGLGFFNKFVNESGTFYLKFKATHYGSSHKNILSMKTYDVISVKEQNIDPKIFNIDSTKIKWANLMTN